MSKLFSARHIALDEYRRKQVDTWGGRAIPESEHLMVLEDYLSVSLRRRSNAYPLFKLQLALLVDVHAAENAVAACKQKLGELEKTPEGTDRDAALKSVGAEHKKFTTIRRALRDIGDGMAWRLLQPPTAVWDVSHKVPPPARSGRPARNRAAVAARK